MAMGKLIFSELSLQEKGAISSSAPNGEENLTGFHYSQNPLLAVKNRVAMPLPTIENRVAML